MLDKILTVAEWVIAVPWGVLLGLLGLGLTLSPLLLLVANAWYKRQGGH